MEKFHFEYIEKDMQEIYNTTLRIMDDKSINLKELEDIYVKNMGIDALNIYPLTYLCSLSYAILNRKVTNYITQQTIKSLNDNTDLTRGLLISLSIYCSFIEHNKPYFAFDKDLLHRFMLTDITNVSAGSLKLPFPSIYIDLPDIHDDIHGAYLVQTKEGIFILFATDYLGANPGMIEITEDQNEIINIQDRIYLMDQNEIFPINSKKHESVFNLIINCILYINISDYRKQFIKGRDISKIKSPKKLKKVQNSKTTYASYYHYRYINPIKLNPRDDVMNPGSSGNIHTMVRGHWRNQAYGKKFSQHKMIWIEPYIKGDIDKGIRYKIK